METRPPRGWVRGFLSLWPFILLATLTWLGWHEVRQIELVAVRRLLREVPADLILALLGATMLSLTVAGFYDVAALGPRSRPPGAGARWSVGVVSFAWSNFVTLGPLAGPALRLWLYRDLGVDANRARVALAAVIASFSLGLVCWCGAVTLPLPAGLDSVALRLLLILPLAWLAWVGIRRLSRLRGAPEVLRRSEAGTAALAIVASVDWVLAWLVFHLALAGLHGGVDASLTLRVFFLGQLIGLASFIPGGLGSADAFWLVALGGAAGGHDQVVTALILYRFVYYVVPWVFATLVLAGRLVRTGRRTAAFLQTVMASYTVLCGAVLLASAATPALTERVAFLRRSVPLALVELSHGVSVVLGFFLLVVSRGLARGYRSSHRVALALFLAGGLTTFLKGFDFEEALLSLGAAAMLVVFHRSFEREGRLRPPVEFVASVGVFAVALFAAVGFGSGAIPAVSDIFNRFGYLAHGPRFLRGLLLLAALASVVAFQFALRARARDRLPDPRDIDRAIMEARTFGSSTNALLVAGGDKAIFRPMPPAGPTESSGRPRGFVAFRTVGRFLIAYSDLVCPPGSEHDLLAAFLDYAASVDRDVILYQISASFLPVAHDFGFSFFKLGEEAIVDLSRFDLRGNKAKTWRHALNSVERAGGRFEIVEAESLRPLLPELRRVSDAWLQDKHVSEMRFSIGRFDEAYLKRFPCAVVRDGRGFVVGFANILEGPRGEELSVDLMRYRSQPLPGPRNIMDYLFLRLMLHGKERGFKRFNLGMAPLSAVGEWRWARPVERLAHFYARLGGRWYNYEGLRTFKEKFDPSWEPRYMAYPRPWDWPMAVASAAALITGGWRGRRFSKGENP